MTTARRGETGTPHEQGDGWDAKSIPLALRELAQWVNWKAENRDGHATKVPHRADGRGRASATDPATWTSFDAAHSARDRGGFDGTGFVLTPTDPFCCADLDHALDDSGAPLPFAVPWLALDTYTELSPSGTGLHLWFDGALPDDAQRRGYGRRSGNVEIYAAQRFITCTGHRYGDDNPIQPIGQAFAEQYWRTFPPVARQESPRSRPTLVRSDQDVLDRAFTARNGERVRRLFAGDTSGHGDDDSAADLGLLASLAFWTQDRAQLDRLFRSSGLCREKWQRSDYRERTIDRALERADRWTPPNDRIGFCRDEKHGDGVAAERNAEDEKHSAGAPVDAAETNSSLFRSARALAETTPDRPDWIVPGIAARGATTELDGKMKLSGKTTFLSWLVRAVLDGSLFLNQRTRTTPVVWLTEQTPATFRDALRRAGLLTRDDLSICCWADAAHLAWPQMVAAAVAETHRVGAKLLVVDTLGQWAGLRGDAENSAGAALAAIDPLQRAAAGGLAVILTRHDRKSGGDVGESGRGSSAFGGAVDIILRLARGEGNARPTLRLLSGVGRLDDIPDELAIELIPNVGYSVLGDHAAVAQDDARRQVMTALPTSPEDALTLDQVLGTIDAKRTVVQGVLVPLVEAQIVVTVGEGKRGDPRRFYRRETEKVSAATPSLKRQKETRPLDDDADWPF